MVGEEAWSETLVDAEGAKELGEFVDSALAVWLGGDGENIAWLFNGDDHAGGELDLFPDHSEVEDVGGPCALVNVWLHSE